MNTGVLSHLCIDGRGQCGMSSSISFYGVFGDGSLTEPGAHLPFYVDSRGLNLSSHACKARALLREPFVPLNSYAKILCFSWLSPALNHLGGYYSQWIKTIFQMDFKISKIKSFIFSVVLGFSQVNSGPCKSYESPQPQSYIPSYNTSSSIFLSF